MAIKPLKDRVIATKKAAEARSASGLYLGEAKEKPSYAVVESVGPEVKTLKKGDKIIYKEYSATTVEVDKQEYLVIKEEDILATL